MPRGYNRRNNDGARMRMDSYRGSNNNYRGNNNNNNNNDGGGRAGGYRRNNIRRRPSNHSPRRRELGHVMQHARRDGQNSYWTRRLLEAEERDPNRWRHSGFKEMYRDELKDNSGSRDDSASSGSRSRSSRSRSPVTRPRSPGPHKSPPNRQDRTSQRRPRPRSPPSPPSKRGGSRDKSRGRPRTPSHKRSTSRQHSKRSESYSSSETVSSCSDDSCSVCSPKHGKTRGHSPPTPPTPPPKKKVANKKTMKPKEDGRKVTRPRKVSPKDRKKKSDTRRPKSPPPPRTPESSSDSSSSSTESESSSEDTLEQPKLSLSERFGKMAQWSVDRKEYDSIKMRITKDDGASSMKVVIENDAELPLLHTMSNPNIIERPIIRAPSPEKDYAFHYERRRSFFERSYTRERPIGPDVPINWMDPMARYTYYRSKGLLWENDVSFEEYIKWELWWVRFQEWLDAERACYGADIAIENARRERERDWESYRSSNMGRTTLFDRELLPLPRNQPWDRPPPNRSLVIRGRGGLMTRRKFLRT